MSKSILFSILRLFLFFSFSLSSLVRLTRLVNLSSMASMFRTSEATEDEAAARARERSSSRALLLLLAFDVVDVDGASSTEASARPLLFFKLVAAAFRGAFAVVVTIADAEGALVVVMRAKASNEEFESAFLFPFVHAGERGCVAIVKEVGGTRAVSLFETDFSLIFFCTRSFSNSLLSSSSSSSSSTCSARPSS